MTTIDTSRRNAIGFAITALTSGLLMLYPTSTHGGTGNRVPGRPLAAPGVVTKQTGSTAKSYVVNGKAVDTPFGLVQVQLDIKNGKIVKAVAIDYPQGSGRDQEINSYAIPMLQSETVHAQGAQIDTVSGATYTSQGYISSLQSAIDAAHL